MAMYDSESSNLAPRAVAVIFADVERAREALRELHAEGFRDLWLGVTRAGETTSGEPTVEAAEGGGFLAAIERFFSGEGGQPLHEALVRHGLSEAQARTLGNTVTPGDAIVTVDAVNDPDAVLDIVRRYGGRVQGATSGVAETLTTAAASETATGAYDVAESRPVAAPVSEAEREARRLQLREERLAVNKTQATRGEAVLRKEVVEQQQSVDVPVFHEELFIERRPVSGERAASAEPIGAAGQEIRVPLTEERVEVEKRPVVTEEIAIGKRRVEDTQHVSETVRREELRVDDSTGVTTTGATEAPDIRTSRTDRLP